MTDPSHGESVVSEGSITIPEHIRRRLAIEDGDRLRWILEGEEGAVRLEIHDRSNRAFADFDGYDGDSETDTEVEHDVWGV